MWKSLFYNLSSINIIAALSNQLDEFAVNIGEVKSVNINNIYNQSEKNVS